MRDADGFRVPDKPARLLVLACSQTKSDSTDPLPACERYTGPLWLTLKACDPFRQRLRAQVAYLSAEHGFGDADDTPLAVYDKRLTPQAAAGVAQALRESWRLSGMPRGHRERQEHEWTRLAHTGGQTLGRLVRRCGEPFREIAVCGGELYLAPMLALVEAAKRPRAYGSPAVAADCVPHVINGPIGKMRQELRAWWKAGPLVLPAGERRDAA
jgi:hypothetical protein